MIKRIIVLIVFLIFSVNYVYAARDRLTFSTYLNKPDSVERPARYFSGEILEWNYRLYNNASFNANVCFFLKDPNYIAYDITKIIVDRANEQYCNNRDPQPAYCPINLSDMSVGTTDQPVTGNIFTYTIPRTGLLEGTYMIIAQLRDPNIKCSNSDGRIPSTFPIAESINYVEYRRSNIGVEDTTRNLLTITPNIGLVGTIFSIKVKEDNRILNIDNPRIVIQKPDRNAIATLTLFDDGAHGDFDQNDGVWGNIWDSAGVVSSIPTGDYYGDYYIDLTFRGSTRDIIEIDNANRFSIIRNSCVEVMRNGNPDNKINVVFIGDMFTDLNDFRNQVEMHAGLRPGIDSSTDGILNIEPFLSNRDKFNIYLVNTLSDLDCTRLLENGIALCNFNTINSLILQCPHDFVNVLSRRDFRSYASGPTITSIGSDQGSSSKIRVSVHEFGHSFGNLRDEYVERRGYHNFDDRNMNCFAKRPLYDQDCGPYVSCFEGDRCLANCNPPDPDCVRNSCNAGDSCAVGCTPIDPDCGNGASCNAGDSCAGGGCIPTDPDCLPTTCDGEDGCLTNCRIEVRQENRPPSYRADYDCNGITCNAGDSCAVGCTPIDPDCGNGVSCNAGDGCAGGSCFRSWGEQYCLENSRWEDLNGNGCGQEGITDCQETRRVCPDYDPQTGRWFCYDELLDPNGRLEIGCFEGCGYLGKNIFRPAFNTIMRSTDTNPYSFGQVNERFICQEIKQKSGSAGGSCDRYRLS